MAPPPGSTPSRTGGFLGTTSPGPMAELYGAANQDSGVSSYISAASPAPSTGFGHSLGVSVWSWRTPKVGGGKGLVCLRGRGRRGAMNESVAKREDRSPHSFGGPLTIARCGPGTGDVVQIRLTISAPTEADASIGEGGGSF